MEINGFEIEDFNIHGFKSGEKTAICPICSHERKKNPKQKCLSLFWDTGLGQCNHCGERIQLHTYKKREDIKVYQKPKTEVLSVNKQVVDYFEGRGIGVKTLTSFKIGVNITWMPKAQNEITVMQIPYYLRGQLINIKSRGKNKDFKFEKDCEQILFNIDAIIGQKFCVLTEGEPDCMSYHEAGITSVASVPNGFTLPRADGTSTIRTAYLDDYYHIFDDIDAIYLAFDNDVAGTEGQKEFVRRLGAEKCYIVNFEDCKDANEYLIKYGKEKLANTIATAKQVPLEGVITIYDNKKLLEDFWRNGAPKGATIGLPSLDNIYSIAMKQYTLLVSAPGSGKSDLIDQIVLKLCKRYEWKAAYCSPENTPSFLHHDKIFRKLFGRRPSDGNVNDPKVSKHIEFINDHIFHIEQSTRFYLQDVFVKFKELIRRKGVRIFVLDPFNKIKLKGFDRNNITEYTEEYHIKLDEFCQENDCHIFLVLHPIKLSHKRLAGDTYSDKTFVMPNAYQCKGGGEHFDMSYNILGLVRDFERNVVQIRTLKIKFQHLGESLKDGFFMWNINNGRYTELNEAYDDSCKHIPSVVFDNSSWLDKQTPVKEAVETLPLPSVMDAFDVPDPIDDLEF